MPSTADNEQNRQGSAVSQLAESCLDLKWHLDPVEATAAGVHNHDHRLGLFGVDDVKHGVAALKSMASALEGVSVESLDCEIDRTALLNDVRVAIHRFEVERQHERNPGFWISHALEGLYLLLVSRDRSAEHRRRAAAERIRSIPGFLKTARDTLESIPQVFADTAAGIADAGQVVLEQVQGELCPDDDAFAGACVAASDAVRDFSQYLKTGRGDDRDSDFAIGESAFNFRLNYEHALQATSSELWRYGTKLVELTELELARIASRIDSSTSWPDLVGKLREEQPAPDELVAAYAAEVERSRASVISHNVAPVPAGLLEVVDTPGFLRPLIPVAAYQPPGAFSDDKTGWFYVTSPSNAEADDDVRLSGTHCVHELACTAVHEGFPGHHLQLLNAHEQPSIVRKVVGSAITIEGWALYCEELMEDFGFYRSLEEELFRRLALLWRAVRVLADVGLHTRGMSLEEAVTLLTDRVHLDRNSAEIEVRRYCSEPAYQVCYAVGLRELQNLRKDFRAATGDGFTDRDFHQAVLSYGGLPVSFMRWGMRLNA